MNVPHGLHEVELRLAHGVGRRNRGPRNATSNSSRLSATKPGSVFRRFENPRTSQPAPATSMIASATSATVIAMSQRAVPRPALAERELSFMSVFMSLRSRRIAGASPMIAPVTTSIDEREEQHARIERHRVEARQLRRADREQRAETQCPDADADDRAGGREHDRLGQQLPNEPAPARAERRAHGHLARPRRAAGEQQIGDVHAREEEQQPGRRHDDDRIGPRSPTIESTSGSRDVDAVAVRRGKVGGEAGHHGRHLAFRALDRRAGRRRMNASCP